MTLIHRREMLIGALGLAALPACAKTPAGPPARSANLIAGTICPVTPEQTEGPFYFDPELSRRDITEGKPGVPLRLRLQIVAAADCEPFTMPMVEIWHCDAGGAYSGYDRERSAGQRWLRGSRTATIEEAGVVAFDTIYPGWYDGRAPHIHLKVHMPTGLALTSQIYFPEELSDGIYREGPYAARSGRRMRNGDDGIFQRLGDHPPIVEVTRREGSYEGAIVIAPA